ncbi:MAG: hypothetical protein HZA51_10765 [Planctomycetes bacterium]|nr:hypothetical protein [Planctomycetota bacterium]
MSPRKTLKLARIGKRVLIVLAALPLLQTTGCDLLGISGFFAQDFTQNLAFGLLTNVVRGTTSTLSAFFPSADFLQAMLGGNLTQFVRN